MRNCEWGLTQLQVSAKCLGYTVGTLAEDIALIAIRAASGSAGGTFTEGFLNFGGLSFGQPSNAM